MRKISYKSYITNRGKYKTNLFTFTEYKNESEDSNTIQEKKTEQEPNTK